MNMKVEIQIDENCGEPRLIVVTRQITDEIQTLIQSLSNTPAAYLAGFQEDELVLLQPREIIRIYAQEKKTIAEAEKGRFIVRLSLQEVQARFSPGDFVRISHSS